jgi:tRNA A-37 threonylcarbamoyl transferase component Bud32
MPEGGRRGYVKASYQGGQIFIKSFAEKGLPGFIRNRVASRGKKEYQLGRRLLALSIPTPRPLGYGVSRMASYTIQEWVEGKNLLAALKETDYSAQLLNSLAGFLKTLKIHHVRHNDLHLDNILVVDGELYIIDLHKTRIKDSFTILDEVSNLSHALAPLYGELDKAEKDAFFAMYGNPGLEETVGRAIDRMGARWVRRKKERAFAPTSLIVAKDSRLHMTGMENRDPGTFEGLIKSDRKVKIERYTNHVRKIYRNRRRLERAWRAHVVIAYMGLPIVPEAYYVELPGDNPMGHIAMEDLKGRGEELDRWLDRRYVMITESEKRLLKSSLANYFLGLARKKIMHKDLKACNIFVLQEGGFILLDVEDIRFRSLDEEALKRMLVQLNTTIPRRVSTRDRMRFFLEFTSPMKVDRKAIFKAVVKESLRREIVYEGIKGLTRETW